MDFGYFGLMGCGVPPIGVPLPEPMSETAD